MGRKPVTTYRHRRGRSRLRPLLLVDVLAGVLALAGLAALNSHLFVASGTPPVRVSGALPAPTTSTSRSIPAISATPPAMLTGVPRSVPLQLSIPAIKVRTQLVRLGLNPDGTLQVPTDFSVAGWYALGSSPGEPGAAVIVGHVDSKQGPAVFYGLGELAPGSLVHIALADQAEVVFRVYAVREYAKTAFPTSLVYGATPGPELRLVTCGGQFDALTGHYLDNVVVFARYVG
jgi:sortase family protein